jgi:hypothetical protein
VQKSEKISFGLLEIEMADLERFWRKTPLGPLGVKNKGIHYITKIPIHWYKCHSMIHSFEVVLMSACWIR